MMTTDLHDMTALYALGMLEEQEKPAFEDHLRGCAECQEELRGFRGVAEDLGTLAAAEPPPALRGRLREQVGRAPKTAGVVLKEHGIYLAMADELPWRSALPGVDVKPLYIDRERRYGTSLVRLAAGASYPRHKHNDLEEIFVLSGEIELEGNVARAGAYCRAEGDSIHAKAYSATGCTFLVVASLRDELLP
jgi:anti-sigma factor ChrR (cupin superfamily)